MIACHFVLITCSLKKLLFQHANIPHTSLVVETLKVLWDISFFRFITIYPSTTSSNSLDLRTLRAVRVLRPLKLVSGIPSMYIFLYISLSSMQLSLIFKNLHYSCIKIMNILINMTIFHWGTHNL